MPELFALPDLLATVRLPVPADPDFLPALVDFAFAVDFAGALLLLTLVIRLADPVLLLRFAGADVLTPSKAVFNTAPAAPAIAPLAAPAKTSPVMSVAFSTMVVTTLVLALFVPDVVFEELPLLDAALRVDFCVAISFLLLVAAGRSASKPHPKLLPYDLFQPQLLYQKGFKASRKKKRVILGGSVSIQNGKDRKI